MWMFPQSGKRETPARAWPDIKRLTKISPLKNMSDFAVGHATKPGGFPRLANSLLDVLLSAGEGGFRRPRSIAITVIAGAAALIPSHDLLGKELYSENLAVFSLSQSDQAENQKLEELVTALNEGSSRERSGILLSNGAE